MTRIDDFTRAVRAHIDSLSTADQLELANQLDAAIHGLQGWADIDNYITGLTIDSIIKDTKIPAAAIVLDTVKEILLAISKDPASYLNTSKYQLV